jgi:hypothetical protein
VRIRLGDSQRETYAGLCSADVQKLVVSGLWTAKGVSVAKSNRGMGARP